MPRDPLSHETVRLDAGGIADLRTLIPPELRRDWKRKSDEVRIAGAAAPIAAAFAVARAQPVDLTALRREEVVRLTEKYLREIGRIPPLFRLRPNQRWLETIDDAILPAGLYEESIREIYQRFGWRLASYWWLGWRNRAYAVAARYQFRHQPGVTYYTWGEGSMEPFKRGQWLCVAMLAGVSLAYEFSKTWDYPLLPSRCGQYREGWKLRPLAQGDRPDPDRPTATGILQVPSWRPLQRKVLATPATA